MSNFIFVFSICLITIMVSYTTWVNYDKFQEWQFAKESVEKEMFEKYYSYLSKFNKKYGREEFFTRIEHFKKTLEELSRLEAIQPGVYGLNKFSDMSEEERQKMLTPIIGPCLNVTRDDCQTIGKRLHEKNSKFYTKIDILPKKFDWRDHGVVSKVLNQRRCHACWAMSIVGVMESMAAIQYEYLIQLSSQEVIDCSINNGCDSGDVRNALYFLCVHDFPIVPEREYPLKLVNEECRIDKNHQSGMRIKHYTNQCNMKEDEMLRLIANHGPLVAVVNAKSWPYYIGGVIQMACDNSWKNMDHVVQIVGYDLTADVPYYIVRNSWGEDFGLDGYLKLAVNRNMCGVANNVAYFDVVYK